MELQNIIGQYLPILDHGFVSLQGVFGGDEDVEQFARTSYKKGTRKTSDTRGLIRYLIRNRHSSPVEAVEFKFHIRAPLFVVQQWLRHRTASINQQSARYSVLPRMYYVPEPAQIQKQSTTNKQGREEGFSIYQQRKLSEEFNKDSEQAFAEYEAYLESGVARETARMVLPANTYTEFYWKIDLRNLLHFLSLRCDPHAQWEIRQYANAIARMVELACPLVYEAFIDYQLAAVTFSRMEMDVLRRAIRNSEQETTWFTDELRQEVGMTEREWTEFQQKFTHATESIPVLDFFRFRSPEVQETFDSAYR